MESTLYSRNTIRNPYLYTQEYHAQEYSMEFLLASTGKQYRIYIIIIHVYCLHSVDPILYSCEFSIPVLTRISYLYSQEYNMESTLYSYEYSMESIPVFTGIQE